MYVSMDDSLIIDKSMVMQWSLNSYFHDHHDDHHRVSEVEWTWYGGSKFVNPVPESAPDMTIVHWHIVV